MDPRNVALRNCGNSIAGGEPDPHPSKKQVRAQMGHMGAAIDRLEAFVPVLLDVLAPVLNAETPKETTQQGRPPYTTPLAEDLAYYADRVDNVVYALRQLIDRVEL